MLQESLDFQAKERSFYEVLGQKYPPSPSQESAPNDQYNPKEDGINVENNNEVNTKGSHFEKRGKKNHHAEEYDCEEERRSKLPAVHTEFEVPTEEFDEVLLCTVGEREKNFEAYRTELINARSKNTLQVKRAKGRRVKKPNKTKEMIDLRSLLMNCAQFVAADDRGSAKELLRQIREHSSPIGNGIQRLAHYFADGLEARLAGTGSHIHKAIVYKRTTASDFLKAYYTSLAVCPFQAISTFVSSTFIAMKSEKAMRVHVIDFGILYGFQWPTFIQNLSEREGGPPKLRVTGIEVPQPGFRPAERVEDTGHRLARYAETFNVPFEFNAIAQNWETIKIEDFKIEKGEFVAVNCLYRAGNLPDEASVAESSRTMVLQLIRKIDPDIFIHGIINASFGLPFFVTRFRQALFHFSALYDMLDANIPREKPERILIERDLIGKEAVNVIACEGWSRVQRPETYKQWRVRHLKAGFFQIPFERKLMDNAMYKVRNSYHREFIIDEDDKWLLLGWKGRMMYAISCWQPV
ncbi:scarecrow-like protein 9 [Phtheirospermum japonicum]|uniref:Scarecrow-like protein 9 n=1 Tax=Phtheirospermum japonicum TaxID=374723 RepID=A0A830CBA5_9LAMI|nr:scarecrow-like protein 9 [Phtheirospermum japonicum]